MDIANFGSFTIQIAGIGEVKCSRLKGKHIGEIGEYLSKGVPKNREFIRFIITAVGQKEVDNDGDEFVPLTDSEAELISEEDLEAFAEQFLAKNRDLYEESESGVRDEIDEDGKKKSVVERKPSHASIPRKAGEAAIDYLSRVVQAYVRELEEQASKVFSSLPFSGFSKGLFSANAIKSIKENLGASKQLSAMLGGVRSSTASRGFAENSARPTKMASLPPLNFPENPAHETNRRLNQLIAHVEELSPILPQSAEVLQTMNNAVITMQADLYANAKKAARWNFFVIGIAAVSLVVTAVYSWWSYQSYTKDREQMFAARESEDNWRTQLLLQGQTDRQQLQALITSILEKDVTKTELLLKTLDNQNSELIEAVRNLQKADSQKSLDDR